MATPTSSPDDYSAFRKGGDDYTGFDPISDDADYSSFAKADPITEGQKASMGALQALDVMAAPRQLDWSDVARTNGFQLEKETREKFRLGQISEPEAMASLRRADEMRGILPEQRQQEMAAGEAQAYQERVGDLSNNPIGRFMGSALYSQAGPVLESAARNLGPAAGGAGGAAMFMAPAAGPAGVLFPLMGGFMGSMAGGAGQEALLQSTETPEETQQRKERWAQAAQENPNAEIIGSMASNLGFFRPSPSTLSRAFSGERGALKNVAAAAGIGAGAPVIHSIVSGQPLSLQDIAVGAMSNALMSEPTRLGRMMGFHASPASPIAVADAITAPSGPAREVLRGSPKVESLAQSFPAREVPEIPIGEQNAIPKQVADESVLRPTETGQEGLGLQEMGQGNAVAQEAPANAPEAQQIADPQSEAKKVGPIIYDGVTELGGDGFYNFSDTESKPGTRISFTVESKTAPTAQEIASKHAEALSRFGIELPKPPPVDSSPEPTGIRNSIVDARRRTAQMEAREIPAQREFGTVLDEAKAVHAQDPLAATRLVNELKENVRPLTDSEDALLTIEQNRRELVREEAIDAVNNATDEASRDAALEKLAAAENEAFEVYQVGQNAGTQNARGLNARRLMIQKDYSLAKMLNETRALRNAGEPLSEAQTKEITELHSRIADLESKLATKENRDAQQAAKLEYQDLLRNTKQEAQVAAKEKKSVVDFFESQAEKARQRIIARRGKLQVTIDPLNLAGLVDEAIIGASHVARGVRDFAQWSKEMLKEFGSRIEPHLKPLWDRANQIESENAGAFKTKDTRNPEEVLANAKGLDRALITDLARAHINQGVEGFENVIGAVEKDLKTQFPDVTTRQIHDALSGYGKITKPSQAEDLKKLREYRSLARLTSQLEDAQKGLNPLKTGPQRDKATARVRELQKQVNDAMEAAGLKRTREDQLASSLDAAKTRIKNATEELQRKIDRRDYTERPKREQQVDKERIDLEFELSKVKQEYQKGLIEARRARRTTGEKIWDTTVEGANLSRQLLTSGDFPPVFRQGLFSIGRPKIAGKALKDALISMFSEKKRFAVDREIQNRENAPLYQRAKLYLAKDTGQTLTQQEEAYMGNWFKEMNFSTGKNLPITPVGRAIVRGASGVTGAFLRASERSYNTFLNKLRADTFDAAIKAFDIAPTDTKNLRAMADVINTMTGRAKLPLKSLEQGAGALNAFLFAPRFFASRLKLATGQPMWSGTAKSRAFARREYARTLAGAALIYGLAKMAGADIETDPRSTDFAKIRFGKTRLDPLGGLIQITNFLTRAVTGETKGKEGVVKLRETMRPLPAIDSMLGTRMAAQKKAQGRSADASLFGFLRTKLNPIAGAAVDIYTGKDVNLRPTTAQNLAVKMAIPISFQDIAQTMEEQGVPKGTAMWILSLFGMGLQTYGKRQ